MNYVGKKSISSAMAVLMRLLWIGVLVAVVAGTLVYGAILLFPSLTAGITEACAQEFQLELQNSLTGKELREWYSFTQQPRYVQALVIPYFIAVAVLLLSIISRTREIFLNFSNDIIFDRNNTALLRKASLLNLAYAILTVNLTLCMVTVVLLILTHVFEQGAYLQEDQDLTV